MISIASVNHFDRGEGGVGRLFLPFVQPTHEVREKQESTNIQIGNNSSLPYIAGNTLVNQIYKNPTSIGSFQGDKMRYQPPEMKALPATD